MNEKQVVIYLCSRCDQVFITKGELKRHLEYDERIALLSSRSSCKVVDGMEITVLQDDANRKIVAV